jgi:hypothetical protein
MGYADLRVCGHWRRMDRRWSQWVQLLLVRVVLRLRWRLNHVCRVRLHLLRLLLLTAIVSFRPAPFPSQFFNHELYSPTCFLPDLVEDAYYLFLLAPRADTL